MPETYGFIIQNLRDAIQESGIKQRIIAERAGKTEKQLSNILCMRKKLEITDVLPLCAVLHIDPNRLYFGRDEGCESA